MNDNVEDLKRQIAELKTERLLLAKLAADKPLFFNPIEVMAARILRDHVLASTVK